MARITDQIASRSSYGLYGCLFHLWVVAFATLLMSSSKSPGQDFSAALDNSSLSFNGSEGWEISDTGAKFGNASVRSGLVPPGTNRELRTTIEGPGWLTFWRKSTAVNGGIQPHVHHLDGGHFFWRTEAVWTLEAFRVPPWQTEIVWSVPAGCALELDQMIFSPQITVPLPAQTFAAAFPIAGAAWETNSALPFVACPGPGLVTGSCAVCQVSDIQPSSWLEVSLDGPGTLSFSTRVYGAAHYEIKLLEIQVDGQPMAGVPEFGSSRLLTGHQGSGSGSPFEPGGNRAYALTIPAGRHSVRWIFDNSEWAVPGYITALLLFDVQFVDSPDFSAVAPVAPSRFLFTGGAAVQSLTDEGVPFIRLASPPMEEWRDDTDHLPVMSAPVTGPGYLSFKWRTAPEGSGWPVFSSWSLELLNPTLPGGFGLVETGSHRRFFLSPTASWQEKKLFIAPGVNHLYWQLPWRNVALDLSDFEWTPFESVPLDVALGMPGAEFNTNADVPWRGVQESGPGGRGYALAPLPNPPADFTGWLQTSLSGPAFLTWRELRAQSCCFTSLLLDGAPADPVLEDMTFGPDTREDAYSLLIPAGLHSLRWRGEGLPGTLAGLTGMRHTPVSAAYAAWSVATPWYPWHISPLPGRDYDGDGVNSLAEFAFNTDPLVASSLPQMESAFENNRLTVMLPAPRPLSDGVRTLLETSTDMATWQTAEVEEVPAPTGKVKYRLPASVSSQSRLYVRSRVEFVSP